MTRIFTVLLLSTMLIACNKDDDNQQGANKIIGNWKLTGIKYGYTAQALTGCMSRNTIQFNKDNTSVTTNYYHDCEYDITNGTWSHKGGNTYMVTLYSSPLEVEITFPDDNTIDMKLDDVIPDDPGYAIYTYKRN